MNIVFYLSAAVAILATALAVTRLNAIHALLYLIVSLLAAALVFFTLGAPFIAALEVIIYAGAIMVLFVFVIMMLDLGPGALRLERQWLKPRMWVGPSILASILLLEFFYAFLGSPANLAGAGPVEPRAVGALLFGPYLLGVELSSILLMAGLIGAFHLGRRDRTPETNSR